MDFKICHIILNFYLNLKVFILLRVFWERLFFTLCGRIWFLYLYKSVLINCVVSAVKFVKYICKCYENEKYVIFLFLFILYVSNILFYYFFNISVEYVSLNYIVCNLDLFFWNSKHLRMKSIVEKLFCKTLYL